MRSSGVAKLEDQLSKYLAFAMSGEEVVILDRNLPVAKASAPGAVKTWAEIHWCLSAGCCCSMDWSPLGGSEPGFCTE
jgi:hypothetical protein